MVGVVSRDRAEFLRIVFIIPIITLVRFLGIELKTRHQGSRRLWTERLVALLLPGRHLLRRIDTRERMLNLVLWRFNDGLRSERNKRRNVRLVRNRLVLLRRRLLRKLVGSRRKKVGERLLRWRLATRPVLKRSARRRLALLRLRKTRG